ncbi:hypothetical protein ACH5RR_030091 [Cinchona calisaya]|uniref:Uncharacterized protein n=1 Tax=Cinchona calisaya TaxID=153742 RepID=A0ABD2YX46_9GENT
MERTPNLPDQLVEEIVPLALPIENFVQEPGLKIIRSNAIMTTDYGWGGNLKREVPEIVEQIGLIENKLEKFLDETDFFNTWEDLRKILVLALIPPREAARDLLEASQQLKDVMNFFDQVTTETGYSTRSIEVKKDCIEKMAKTFLDEKNGMRLVLLETLGKLHSFVGD